MNDQPTDTPMNQSTTFYCYARDRLNELRATLDRELAYLDDLIAGRETYPRQTLTERERHWNREAACLVS